METRPRTRLLRRAVVTAALGALVVPASAGAAVKTPVIKKVTPKNVSVGETLTIHGKNFRSGKAKNTVLFKRDKGKALFVKAGLSTKKRITVVIPKSLEKYMVVKHDAPAASRFRLRVLTKKLSKRYTSLKASPTVGPEKLKPTDDGGTGTVTLDPNADTDGDGLTNAFEQGVVLTDPAKADTDGDGATDGFEYSSAVDLNNDDYRRPTASLPYPGKRAYPNPLDNSDANTDHDGDALTLVEEFALWNHSVANGYSASVTRLNYSAGLKYSVYTGGDGTKRTPALAASGYDKQVQFETWLANSGYATIDLPHTGVVGFFDLNRDGTPRSAVDPAFDRPETRLYDNHGVGGGSAPDGWLSDDERDEDADGLSNWMELRGPMLPTWYASRYKDEKAYPVVYDGVSPVDPDTDGDGVRDGADDQDHDDVPNYHELSRNMALAAGGWDALDDDLVAAHDMDDDPGARVDVYNPCLPYTDSRTCPVSVPFTGAWAPFNREKDNDKFFVFN